VVAVRPRIHRGDVAGGQGARPGAGNVGVEFAIGVVVDDAPRGSHDEDAEYEHQGDVWIRLALAGDP